MTFDNPRRKHSSMPHSTVAARRTTSQEVLDSFRVPLLLVDRRRRLLHANPPAENLIKRAELLAVRDGRLFSPHPGNNGELASALDRLFEQADADGEGARKRHVLPLVRPDGHRVAAVMLSVRRRSAAASETHAAHQALLSIVHAPDIRPELAVLQRVYGLTPAEARLAATLSCGVSPVACARELNVKISTVRTQLNSVFRKTGTKTQAQLVALTLSLGIL
jgi:DNA-binding CsgD family transcriptional regulator